jgi:hypothetical protein
MVFPRFKNRLGQQLVCQQPLSKWIQHILYYPVIIGKNKKHDNIFSQKIISLLNMVNTYALRNCLTSSSFMGVSTKIMMINR